MSSNIDSVRTNKLFNHSVVDFFLKYGVLFAFAIIVIVFSLTSPVFLTGGNMIDLLKQISIVTILSFGMTIIITSGGIDLSVGATVGIAGLAMATVLEGGGGTFISCLVALIFGLLIGILNALLIARANLNPFIATLGTLLIGNSAQILYTRGGLPIYLIMPPKSFIFIAHGKILGLPLPVLILLIVFIIYYLMTHRSVFGRYLYALGDNIATAELSGIKVRNIMAKVYIISGITAAVAGILLASKVMSGQPLAGESYLWDAIAAAFMGTIVSKIGKPSLIGTAFGALFVGVVMNGLTLLNVIFYWQIFAKGFILLFVLAVWAIQQTKKGS